MIKTEKDIDYKRISLEEKVFWSPTSLKMYDECPKQYFLYKIIKAERKAQPEIIRGNILHRMIENFWKVKDNRYVDTPSYKDEEAFAGVARSRIAFVRKEAYEKRIIKEGYVDENLLCVLSSKRFIEETEEMARMIYRRYSKEEEKEKVKSGKRKAEITIEGYINFDNEKIFYKAKIDELLTPLIIRDHKSGYYLLSEEFIKKDLQFSFYALSLWQALQKEDSLLKKDYMEYANLDLESFLDLLEIQIHHIPSLYRLREKNLPLPIESQIISTKRNVNHIKELIYTLKQKEAQINSRNFHPTTNTYICSYKCGYKEICENFDTERIIKRIEEENLKRKKEENSLFEYFDIRIG
ncbi:MAG: PD-(D/E)XK nuclease family protein, partial [Candidatus Pacearchaeota archaeon]